MKYIKQTKKVDLWNGGYCESYDFSQANSCEEARRESVLEIAKICRGKEELPDKLYDHLLTEHAGKAGELFQFIPIRHNPTIGLGHIPNTVRFGYKDNDYHNTYLTNLRALLETYEPSSYYQDLDCAKGFYVFKCKIPLMIVPQILRHGQLSFMQQSERHCKLREYYLPKEMVGYSLEVLDWAYDSSNLTLTDKNQLWNDLCYSNSQCTWDVLQERHKWRQELTNKGSHGLAYTTLWIAGWKKDPSQWDNFFSVRLQKNTQKELRELAEVMKQLMEE